MDAYSGYTLTCVAIVLSLCGCQSAATASAAATDPSADAASLSAEEVSDSSSFCDPGGGSSVVDAAFSPREWSCQPGAQGQDSRLFLRLEGDRLHLLLDWQVRSDQPLAANMFAMLVFSTGGGTQHWQVRIFGDGHGQAWLGGQAFAAVQAATAFGSSPGQSKPHAIFEFMLGSDAQPVKPGAWVLQARGPAAAADLLGHPPTSADGIAGSVDPMAALTLETKTFFGSLLANTDSTVQSSAAPMLVAVSESPVAPGADVTVITANLGNDSAPTQFGAQKAEILSWTPWVVTVRAPSQAGSWPLFVALDGQDTNALQVEVVGELPTNCNGLPLGRPCDDGLACTKGDACDALGQCLGTLACLGESLPCVAGTCAANGQCVLVNQDGNSCDDGDGCTAQDHCSGGICLGTGTLSCDDANPCTNDSCDKLNGCIHMAQPGLPCEDGNLCSGSDICASGGLCAAGPTPTCSDGKPCTIDSCEAKIGCVFKVVADGGACDDGLLCTAGDVCMGGQCAGESLIAIMAPPGNCHQNQCDPTTGKTSVIALTQGPCDDGASCTQNDQCVAGQCIGISIICDDQNPCTGDSCDVATNQCTHSEFASGVVCDDGNACTEADACKNGVCSGKTVNCDDKNPKTVDSCSPVLGCVHQGG